MCFKVHPHRADIVLGRRVFQLELLRRQELAILRAFRIIQCFDFGLKLVLISQLQVNLHLN